MNILTAREMKAAVEFVDAVLEADRKAQLATMRRPTPDFV
jgi:hypothetical protein